MSKGGVGVVEHFRSLLAYERFATDRVAESLGSVSTSGRASAEYAKACSLFAHIQQATHLWLARMGAIERRTFEMFPAWSPEQTVADAATVHGVLERFLAGVDQPGLARVVEYTSTEGTRYRSTVAEILTHLFNHATYHRGQIAMLVTQAGGRRAVTDAIAFSRRAV